MTPKNRLRLKARARIVKAIAHPTRLFLLEELAGGERCVCDLTKMVGADISTVSRHLTVLRNAGLIADDRRGAQIFYSLCAPCILKFMGCIEKVVKANASVNLASLR
jgi:ArsR family transcriptional regulator